MYKSIIVLLCILIVNFVIKIDRALSRDLEEYNKGESCSIDISVKNYGSMKLQGRLHEYPRSGFCCIAQPLALSYKNAKVDKLMNQTVKAAEQEDYSVAIIYLHKLLQIKELPDARRALLAAYGAKNGATIIQSQDISNCSLITGKWIWIRTTGTGDTFGRF